MTGVPLSEIEGCLIAKKIKQYWESSDWDDFNHAIDLQGSIKLTLNREKLAIAAHNGSPKLLYPTWEIMPENVKECWRKVADAIISSLPTLLEVVKE